MGSFPFRALCNRDAELLVPARFPVLRLAARAAVPHELTAGTGSQFDALAVATDTAVGAFLSVERVLLQSCHGIVDIEVMNSYTVYSRYTYLGLNEVDGDFYSGVNVTDDAASKI